MQRHTILGVGTALVTALVPLTTLADYPERDIRVVVPWAAGGGTDAIVRKISNIAEQELPVSMYVENIEGGVSATGVNEVMNARPDGYTIVALTYDSIVTVPWQNLLPSYDLDDLKMIARVTSEADALIADADSDYQTLQDVLDAAKENPGDVRVAVQNQGGRVQLTMLQLEDRTDTDFNLIAYPGGAAPQKEALLNDEADLAITSLGDFANLLADGTARGIVEFSDTPNPTYDVPIAPEAGVDLQNGSFVIFAAPAGTPDAAIETLESAYKTAYESDEFQQWAKKVGVTPNWLGTDKVTQWATDTAEALYKKMDSLVEAGVLSK